jgi:hypothetical protein
LYAIFLKFSRKSQHAGFLALNLQQRAYFFPKEKQLTNSFFSPNKRDDRNSYVIQQKINYPEKDIKGLVHIWQA